MEPKPPFLLTLLLLSFSHTISPLSPHPHSPPSPPALSPSKAPSPLSPPSSSSSPSPSATPSPSSTPISSSPSTLDPKQLTALQSLNIPTYRDPCAQPTLHSATACDAGHPFRHLLSLRLLNCSEDVQISVTALKSLSTLRDLQFLNCPVPPVHFPPDLASNLRSFTCIRSLRQLTGVWLGRLRNLTDLTVSGVPVKASGPFIILGNMKDLRSVTISNANLTGHLPKQWNLNITRIDLSRNRIRGDVPSSITLLSDLESLNLSQNALSGQIPDSFGDLLSLQNVSLGSNSMSGPIPDSMSEIPALVHLDLSSNQFNGTIPKFLNRMKSLKYLNLENNSFHGVMPFNVSFITRLTVFKVGGNSDLCYNHSMVSSKLKLGVARCDKDGLPVSSPPDRSSDSGDDESSSDSGDDEDDSSSGGGSHKSDGHHGPSKIVLGVAIGLSSIVFLIVFLVLLSKCCK